MSPIEALAFLVRRSEEQQQLLERLEAKIDRIEEKVAECIEALGEPDEDDWWKNGVSDD
jgi:hypothetical protein